MKSKAPLVMMEQMVMILVFALAAALCMRAFVLSSSLSEEAERRDIAVLLCENAAESCKGMQKLGGGAETEPYTVYYDAGGFRTETDPAYRVQVEPLEVEEPLAQTLAKAVVRTFDEATGKELYHVEFVWQREVS